MSDLEDTKFQNKLTIFHTSFHKWIGLLENEPFSQGQ